MNKITLKKLFPIIFFLVIFILAIAVWYSPIIFKGYSAVATASNGLVRARNFALTNHYSTENNLNVILNPALIKTQGQESNYGNKLGTIFYGFVLKIIPATTNNQIILLNCFILSLSLVIFCLAFYYLFNLKTAFIAGLTAIFLPTNWLLPQTLVGYEIALLFLSLFILFFSLGAKKFIKEKEIINNLKLWPEGFCLILSGIFLILSCLSREAFFLVLPILFIFLLFIKFKKQLLYVFVPIILIWCFTWLPDFINGKNTYLLFFTTQTQEKLKASDYAYYAHLFPDPYSYIFANQEILNAKQNFENTDVMERLGREKVLANMGQGSIDLWQRFKLGTILTARHIFRFFSITEIGGPIIFCFILLGLFYLKKQKNYWFSFLLSLFGGGIFLLAYANLAGRNHLMDWGALLALLVALGIIYLTDIFTEKFNLSNKKSFFLTAFLTVIVIYNLVLASHVLMGQNYDKSTAPALNYYVSKINQETLNTESIIAVPFGADEVYNLNFITNQSIVAFKEKTIQDLLAKNNLKEAFQYFKITHIIGYNQEFSDQILKADKDIKIISNNNIPIEKIDNNKNNKNWLLNLIK